MFTPFLSSMICSVQDVHFGNSYEVNTNKMQQDWDLLIPALRRQPGLLPQQKL